MYDTVIIGSGPAGLSAAVYARREKLSCIVIEKEFMGSGQIANSERVDNYLGFYGESGFNLGEKFRFHAENLGAEFINEEVISIDFGNNHYKIKLSNDDEIVTKTIIYCAGSHPKKLDIKGENKFTGRGVSYCAICDAAFYEDADVAVVGGGDTALQDALLLSKTANKVYLVHRRDTFRANKTLVSQIEKTDNVETVFNAIPVEIKGESSVNGLLINQEGKERTLSVSGVFIAVGSVPNSQLVSSIVKLDNRGYILADETGKTSAKGLFAAGDVRTKRLRQVITATSDGANCVISAEDYLLNLQQE